MIETIYIEEAVREHPRVKHILTRFPKARTIDCTRYGEVFNPKAQNFRLQKVKPALILAEKYKNFVLEAPPGYGIGAEKNYYFSHMLNCLYDCRYCFLQGMFQSANYILFVNYEDFQLEIKQYSQQFPGQPVHFFSGYDCDSLAMEPVTGFVADFLPFFETLPNAWLELRTKSTQVRRLLSRDPLARCVVAFSFTPKEVGELLEAKTPSVDRRIDAMCKLQAQGWQIGLRFDPIIYHVDYQQQYQRLFEQIFKRINVAQLHSVSMGAFRLPENFFKKIQRLYPEEKLFAGPFESQRKMVSYQAEIEQEMMTFCSELLAGYVSQDKFFPCLV
jgi:spore photoproduct lyase